MKACLAQGGVLAPALFFGATLGAGFQELVRLTGLPTDSEATYAVVSPQPSTLDPQPSTLNP